MIIVTGTQGFIGRHFLNELQDQGKEVIDEQFKPLEEAAINDHIDMLNRHLEMLKRKAA